MYDRIAENRIITVRIVRITTVVAVAVNPADQAGPIRSILRVRIADGSKTVKKLEAKI